MFSVSAPARLWAGNCPRAGEACVFFAQHSGEKRPASLWEGRFFIAPEASFDNVRTATEGASPCRAVRVDGSHQVVGPGLALKVGLIARCEKFLREAGSKGKFHLCCRTRRIRNPLTINNVWRFKMKMVKSLLLGTAAGLVAMTGAQAADLPVKAKPVQYVKICSLYGAGFYYIPGTLSL